jgi:hypothetical protein
MNIVKRSTLAAVILAALLVLTACPGSVHHTYKGFQSAVDRGASCGELIDQRARFTDNEELKKIDAELARIGCATRDAKRTDRK